MARTIGDSGVETREPAGSQLSPSRVSVLPQQAEDAEALHGQPILATRALCRGFGEKDVVDGFDLTLRAAERVGLHGPNGSGKTTILRCIAGTLAPTSGTIVVCGQRVGSLPARRVTGLLLSQERSFFMRLSGRANLVFFARLHGLGRRGAAREVERLSEELELGAILAERADRCSSGMLQQLAIARALVGEPRLLLLDEPTRSLDDAASERFWRAIELRTTAAALIATHLQADLARCDRIVDLVG
jgi:ABC-type multidrug transport system ATPase subunit